MPYLEFGKKKKTNEADDDSFKIKNRTSMLWKSITFGYVAKEDGIKILMDN